jgi:uncharacterized repeat protein (TIGR02543 family)
LGVTLTTADGFAAATDKAKRVGYAAVMAKDAETSAVLNNMVNGSPKTTLFAESGIFLVTVTANKEVKYNLAVFVDGNASLDVAKMIAAPDADADKDEPVVYTLSFNLNYTGAPESATQTVAHNGTATPPVPPTWTDYDFAGWYTEAACVNPWDFTTGTVTGNITLYAKWNPLTFAAAIGYMAETANRPSASYTLQSGSEGYNPAAALTLTAANSPASVTIAGGGRVVTGTTYIPLTVGAGVTLTLKNMTFSQIPFKVTAGGTLVLDNGAVLTGNVNNSAVQVDTGGTLDMKDGEISGNTGGTPKALNADGKEMPVGGGVWVNGGAFTMTGGKISGNNATGNYYFSAAGYNFTGTSGLGGGVAVIGSGSMFKMTGGVIGGDLSADANQASVTNNMFAGINQDGSVSGNAYPGGGGVFAGNGASFTMGGNALITGNYSGFLGGGVLVFRASFTMNGGEITGNTAAGYTDTYNWGGGVQGYSSVDGDPWVGSNKEYGSGPGWIHDNVPNDVQGYIPQQ